MAPWRWLRDVVVIQLIWSAFVLMLLVLLALAFVIVALVFIIPIFILFGPFIFGA